MAYILVHGLGQTPFVWERVMDSFSFKETFICPDLAGLIKGKQADWDKLYQEFRACCDRIEAPLHLCGLSLGAILVLQYSLEKPERVASLTLIGAQYKMPAKLLAFQNLLFRFMPEKAFSQLGFGKKEFLQLCASMKELDLSKELGRISCPVLVVVGEKDKANRRAAEELAEILAENRLEIIPQAGHEVNAERPKELAEVVERFWKSL